MIEQRFLVSGELVVLAALWAIPLGIGLGLLGAVRRGKPLDALAKTVATLLTVVPVFLFADIFAEYLVVRWGVVPLGWDDSRTKAAASFVLALGPAGYVARLVRAAAVETMEQDSVRTARAKGLTRPRILGAHVLRNPLTPFLAASTSRSGSRARAGATRSGPTSSGAICSRGWRWAAGPRCSWRSAPSS